MTTVDSGAARQRTLAILVLGWAFVLSSLPFLPISGISLLMILVGSYGTSTWDPIGFLTVIVAPPAACAIGIGLLLRKTWAWYGAVGGLGLVIVLAAWEILISSAPGGTNTFALGLLTISGILFSFFVSPSIRSELGVQRIALPRFEPDARGSSSSERILESSSHERDWRVGHQGRDLMYYEERHAGGWRRIPIEGEMLMGPAHHAIYVASPASWQSYPEWARDRREEILGRIRSELRPPDYEYQEHTAPPSRRVRNPLAVPLQQRAALGGAILLLLSISGGLGWLVMRSLDDGATWFPSMRPSQRRTIVQSEEPYLFWFVVGLYAASGLGTTGLAFWGAREAYRLGDSQ